MAERVHSRGIPVTLLVREDSFWDIVLPPEESALANRQIPGAGMDLRLQTRLKEIVDDGHGRVCAVITKQGERIDCEFVGLTVGVSPNVDVAKTAGVPVGRGVLVDRSLRSRVPHVRSAGDCAEIDGEPGTKSLLQQVWYTGTMQGDVVAAGMAGSPRAYDPGIWFNSAKFLNLEYQTYGRVNLNVPGESSVYWERADGMAALRVVYTESGVLGFITMGLRIRHEVCERWNRDALPVERVLDRLAETNFDPEFFTRHEAEMTRAFQAQLGSAVT